MKKILVIEDNAAIRTSILDLLDAEGFDGVGAENGETGVQAALRHAPDVILCDIMMPVLDGFGVLAKVRKDPLLAATPFIFLTGKAERSDFRAGMTLGADDYVTKPFSCVELLDAINARVRRHEDVARGAARQRPTAVDDAAPLRKRRANQRLVVRSQAMKQLYEEAAQVALAPISVLLLGETGVGKEVLAHEVHLRSPRRHAPFVPLNCAALSPNLLESELFGHEKGSFTGAAEARPGLFETAHGGTVFLDEIGELDLSTQVKLLRVLEDRIVTRVGGRRAREVDVRFVSATNRDLEEQVRAGHFRQDLFFRINGITLETPPLRARRVAIAPLAEQFAESASKAMGRARLTLHADTIACLERYSWPGNVRELKNVVERAVALCRGAQVEPKHLPTNLCKESPTSTRRIGHAIMSALTPMDILRDEVADLEKDRIVAALESCAGNQTKAAAHLGISRRTLVSRLDAYGLPRPRKNRQHEQSEHQQHPDRRLRALAHAETS